jgi:hypothetical protein
MLSSIKKCVDVTCVKSFVSYICHILWKTRLLEKLFYKPTISYLYNHEILKI